MKNTLLSRKQDYLMKLSLFITAQSRVKWASACDFQQFDILTSVDSDEPV